MKASRLLSILMLLQSHPRLTAATLARSLEVSERTILRDMDQLSAAGVPLWAERGRDGGFQLQPGWSTRLTGMTEPEAQALLLAGLPAAATELGLGEAAATARLKLVASLPAALRGQAATVAERLHIDAVDWYRTAEAPAHLREVAEAVWHSRRLRVRYASWQRTAWRELEPLGLVLKAGAWYLAARRSGATEVRTYRLASMQALAAGDGGFSRPRDFDLARYWQQAAARFEAELRPLQARLRVSPRGLNWLAQARSPVVLLPEAAPARGPQQGWRSLDLAIESIDQGARQVLGFGGEAEVLAPAELRQRVATLAAGLQARHAGAAEAGA